MAALRLDLELPETLLREARDRGLLTPTAIEAMLRDEVRRRKAGEFLGAADQLAADGTPPMTTEEIEAEVEAARRDRRRRDAGPA
jgi:hypothetical protein